MVQERCTWLVATGMLFGFWGCAEQHPAWISEVPVSKSEICAIGVSGPTFYTEDARANSKATALTELARAREVAVKSLMAMQVNGNVTTSDTALQETAGFSSDVVLKQAQVREQWVHPGSDQRYGVKGTVYTLVCMPIGR